MSSAVVNAMSAAMMPDVEVHKISIVEELDGDQVLEACWIDPVEAISRMAGQSKFRDKLYTQFEPAFNELGERVYSRANSGSMFETDQAVDPNSSPLIAVFASDKSYSGQLQGMHLIVF